MESRYLITLYTTRCLKNIIPNNLDEAVNLLFNILGCGFKENVIRLEQSDFVSNYHFTLGMYIRNCFRLWGGSKILDEVGIDNADIASEIIMRRLWIKFREECIDYEGGNKGFGEMKLFISKEIII